MQYSGFLSVMGPCCIFLGEFFNKKVRFYISDGSIAVLNKMDKKKAWE